MKTTVFATLVGILFAGTVAAIAQDAEPRRGSEPTLRVDTGGPSSFVTSLVFSPDGQTLHAAGWDKVVRVWSLGDGDLFANSPGAAFRVPIGPGSQGHIDALAISADGTWLAVAGVGHDPRVANFRESGWILPSAGKTKEMWLDEGTIYLFHRQTRAVHRLRGHQGPVVALAFSSSQDANPVLASAAEEYSEGEFKGAVRLWQLADRKELGMTFVPYKRVRPQLAVLPGNGAAQANRVAVAWHDGALRIWDVQAEDLSEQSDGDLNGSVNLLDPSMLVTCSTRKVVGHLKLWELAGAAPQVDAERQVDFSPSNGEYIIPQAFTLIASNPGQTLDHAAVAALVFAKDATGKVVPRRMQLRVVSLQPGTFGQTMASTGLWSVAGKTIRMPTLAAAARGKHLAVAGGPSHEILVYSISDLLNRNYQPQRLASRAVATRGVAFAEREGELGLLLREQDSPDDKFDVVFPFSSGHLEPFGEPGGWKQAVAADDWKAQLKGTDTPDPSDDHIEVWHQARQVGTHVTWPETEKVTGFAVAPPRAPLDVPVLALATHQAGLPRLSLFNVSTGEQVFQYTGHTGRITSISFSSDFRLLASASYDQTVRVWSLTDLHTVLGRRGQLTGVGLDKELTVVSVASDSPASGLLQVGDRLHGHITAGQFQAWPGKQSFYEHWRTLKPGSQLTVRRTRGNATEPVNLPVGQAVDERKPLFSLLLTGGQLADRQWVGWNPLGPFEASDRRIERYLGWHFNTGDAERPTAFAELDQYRDEYFRRGLLRDLVRDGALLPGPVPQPRRRPAMSLFLPELNEDQLLPKLDEDQLNTKTGLVVPKPLASLELAVDYAFPEDEIEQVSLQVDGNDDLQAEFHLQTDGTWRAELPRAMWQRGEHRLTAVLKTRESSPQEFREQLVFRYVPAAPQITSRLSRNSTTKDEQIKFLAEVQAGSEDEPFDVELRRVSDGTAAVIGKWPGAEPLKIDEAVKLQVGANVFEVKAYNRDAAVGDAETSRERFVITRFVGDTSPPTIQLGAIVVPARRLAESRTMPLHPGRPTVVTTHQVRVQGLITSKKEKLSLAERSIGKGQPAKQLEDFETKQQERFVINDLINLSPGQNQLTYRAQTENSKAAVAELVIDYRPPLPGIEITSPFIGQPSPELMARPHVQLVASVTPPPLADRHRCNLPAVYVNGKRIDEKPTIGGSTLQMSVPVEVGDNDIEIRLQNQWGSKATSRTSVAYRPPPQIDRVDVPKTVNKPFMQLKVSGQTETPIDKVVVDGHVLPPGVANTAGRRFDILIKEQSLEPKQESLTLQVYAKGCATPAIRKIPVPALIAEPPVPPSIEIVDPKRNATVLDPLYTVQFKVTSPSPLRSVEVRQNRQLIFPAQDSEALNPAGGEFRVPVSLQAGTNYLEVTARSDGGIGKSIVTLNRMAPPVSLVVKGFTNSQTSNQLVKLLPDSRGTVRFAEPATSDRVFLQGDVRWNDEKDSRLDKERLLLNVWVNGYRQPAAQLEDRVGKGLTRSFTIPVILNRDRGNLVEIRLPQLPREAASRLLLEVDCHNPLQKKRLHLLVVGVGVSDREALVNSALTAVQTKTRKGRSFTTLAFDEGIIHEPLIGPDVKQSRIWPVLSQLKRLVQQLLQTEGMRANDVVLVYYQGGALALERGQFFLTTQSPKAPALQNAIVDKVELASLSRFFERCCGAQLLLLDVNGRVPQGAASDESWPTTSNSAMLRYAWMKDEPAPETARLIGALDRAKPTSQRLGQLAEELEVTGKARHADELSYEGFVPDILRQLELRPNE